MIRKQTRHWITKDKQKIRICDMSDSHLENAIYMLEKYARHIHNEEIRACASSIFQGEQAEIDQDNFLDNSQWEDFLPEIYDNLYEEQSRRTEIVENKEIELEN